MNWGGLLLGALGLLLIVVAVRGSYANLGRVFTGQAPQSSQQGTSATATVVQG